MGAKKRQTMGKLMRERERAEKRARKQEKKEARKAAAAGLEDVEAAGMPFTPTPDAEGEAVDPSSGEPVETRG